MANDVLVPGAVAMLDILGFKDLSSRIPVTVALPRLRALRAALSNTLERATAVFAGMTLRRSGYYVAHLQQHFAFISDTIVVGLSYEPSNDFAMQSAIQVLGRAVGEITTIAISDDPPFLLRGALSAGDFLIDENILYGPAINEAASYMNRPEAALTYLTPTAAAHLDGIPLDHLADVFVEHTLSMKGTGATRVLIARPTNSMGSADQTAVHSRMVAAFGRPLREELQAKQANTAEALGIIERTPHNSKFRLPALHRAGYAVSGGNELWSNGAEEIPLRKLGDDRGK